MLFCRRHQWYEIIRFASRSLLGSKICDNLLKKDFELEEKDPIGAISRLKKILLNNKRRKACYFKSYATVEHSRAIVRVNRQCCQINSYAYNSMHGAEGDYFSCCEYDSTLKNIDKLFSMSASHHLHVRTVFYVYPMDLSDHVTKKFIQHLFEDIHIGKIIIIPRILLYSINFKCEDSIIIYTHADCTEIAVIVDNVIVKDRWCKLPFTHEHLHQQKNPMRDHLVMKIDESLIDENIDYVDEKRLKVYMPNIYDLRSYYQRDKIRNSQNVPEAYLINEEFYKEMELANTIKKLLDGLPFSTINQLLQAVFLVGKYFKNIKNHLIFPYKFNYNLKLIEKFIDLCCIGN